MSSTINIKNTLAHSSCSDNINIITVCLDELPIEILDLIENNLDVAEIHILRFVSKNLHQLSHVFGIRNMISWDIRSVIRSAVKHGSGSTLDFLHGCMESFTVSKIVEPQNRFTITIDKPEQKQQPNHVLNKQNSNFFYTIVAEFAMEFNRLDLLKLAYGTQNDINPADYYLNLAIRKGHFDLFKWVMEKNDWTHNKSAEDIETYLYFAASYGQLDILKYLFENELSFFFPSSSLSWLITCAALNGHLNIIIWLRQMNISTFHTDACSIAADRGYLGVLQWLHKNGCPWNEEVCIKAASRGHLNILQWALRNGCPYNNLMLQKAVKYGMIHVLDWLKQQEDLLSLDWNYGTLVNYTLGYNDKTFKWLTNNLCSRSSSSTSHVVKTLNFQNYDN